MGWRLSTIQCSSYLILRRHIHLDYRCRGAIRAMEGAVKHPTYYDAVQRLNSTQSGFKALDGRRGQGVSSVNVAAMEQMLEWIQRIGYRTSDFNRLNVVHVAGTKGKGTTCAFVNSILQQYQRSVGVPRKIGLYTSPHLVAVRERIRINSEPISEEQFTKYFFEVWDALEYSANRDGHDPAAKPTYFRFLTLMSFHVFMREGVDAAVYEVGVGGEYDSTNVAPRPAVTGITTLGIDHVVALGDTIDKIAWHKAGIFKNGCPAFTVDQVPQAMKVLKQRAIEKGVELEKVGIASTLDHVNIKPAEDFQRKNASLAIKLSDALLGKLGIPTSRLSGNLPEPFVRGLENVVWRGRCESLISGEQHWHLDGAHTEDSIQVACSWFARISKTKGVPRVLIFNQQSTRDTFSLLKSLHHILNDTFGLSFQYAVFCTNITQKGHSYKVDFVNRNVDPCALQSLCLQKELASAWKDLDSRTITTVQPSIEEAIDYVRSVDDLVNGVDILVTGSFHLVGGALSILEGRDFSLTRATAG